MKYSRVSLLIPDVCLAPGKDPSGAAARSSGAVDASALDSAGLLRRPAEGGAASFTSANTAAFQYLEPLKQDNQSNRVNRFFSMMGTSGITLHS